MKDFHYFSGGQHKTPLDESWVTYFYLDKEEKEERRKRQSIRKRASAFKREFNLQEGVDYEAMRSKEDILIEELQRQNAELLEKLYRAQEKIMQQKQQFINYKEDLEETIERMEEDREKILAGKPTSRSLFDPTSDEDIPF